MDAQRVLIIFEEVPEQVRLVRMTVSHEEANMLYKFHNQYINAVDTDEDVQEAINRYFYGVDNGEFLFKDKCVDEPLVGIEFDLVIKTGIIV